jgi:CubicO group peptidase (beta-lactamase class C family)
MGTTGKDTHAELQAELRSAADELVTGGGETGLQICVIRNGRVVADVTGGTADPGTGAPVREDTLFWAGSTAKGIASSVAHVLVERGELDYGMTAASVWPEFGAHGKDTVTLRHVLSHTAYSPGRPSGLRARPGSVFGMVGMNGSAAYADIDSGVGAAVMRNRFTSGDLATVAQIDRIVARALT